MTLERVAGGRPLGASGYREVVISGINLGGWGRDLPVAPSDDRPTYRFADLIRSILDQTSLQKLRISSVEPMDWTDELISLVAGSSRIARHAHVPMQSGSDRVLRRCIASIVRGITGEDREDPRRHTRAAIGADVMAGFPGETEADFDETRRLIEDLPFTYLHVFTYSARPGTPAAQMSGQAAGAGRPRTQSRAARISRCEAARVHAVICRQDGGSDYAESARPRLYRSAHRQLPETALAGAPRTQPVAEGAGRFGGRWRAASRLRLGCLDSLTKLTPYQSWASESGCHPHRIYPTADLGCLIVLVMSELPILPPFLLASKICVGRGAQHRAEHVNKGTHAVVADRHSHLGNRFVLCEHFE